MSDSTSYAECEQCGGEVEGYQGGRLLCKGCVDDSDERANIIVETNAVCPHCQNSTIYEGLEIGSVLQCGTCGSWFKTTRIY